MLPPPGWRVTSLCHQCVAGGVRVTRALLLCSQAKCSVRLAGSSKSASLSLAVLCGLSREHRFSDQDTKHLGSSPSLTSVMGPTVLEASAGYALAALQPPQAPQTSLTARHCQQTGGKAGARPEWGGPQEGRPQSGSPVPFQCLWRETRTFRTVGLTSLGSPCLAPLPQGRASELRGGSRLWGSQVNSEGSQLPMYLQPKLVSQHI